MLAFVIPKIGAFAQNATLLGRDGDLYLKLLLC